MGSLFFLRLAIGVIFLYHAAPKLQDTQKKAESMGWSRGQVFGLGLVELISAVGLIAGVGAKASAFALMLVMVGALYHKMKKWHTPFSSHEKTGWEFDFLLLLANLTVYLTY